MEAIHVNLNAYKEAGKQVPAGKAIAAHLENPDYKDLLFTFINISDVEEKVAA